MATIGFNETTLPGSELKVKRQFFIVNVIRKFWPYFILAGIIGAAIGLIYAIYKKPYFESRLSFALEEGEGNGMSGALSIAAQFGLNIGGSKDIFAGDNILEIMKSRRMVEKVLLTIDTLDNKPITLIQQYLNSQKSRSASLAAVNFPPNQSRSQFSYLQDSILYLTYVEFNKSKISADKPDRKLSIYEVRVQSENERFAKIFTDKLVEETNNFYTEICSKKAKETLDILEKRVAFMKGNLNSSLSEKAGTQDANVNPTFATAQVPVLKQQANIQVYGAAYSEMFKNLELARYQYLKQIPLMQIIDHADYPMKKIKADKLRYLVTGLALGEFILFFIFWLFRIIREDKYSIEKINRNVGF